MRRDHRIGGLVADRPDARERAGIVALHQARVTDYGGDYDLRRGDV